MRNYSTENFIMLPVPASMFGAVCALLGGTALSTSTVSGDHVMPELKESKSEPTSSPSPSPTPATSEPSGEAAGDPNEVDAGGWPWSADMHAATKGKTKEGFWRMKVGVSRPDPKPGFPKDAGSTGNGATGTAETGAGSPASDTATSSNAGPATDTAEDDEFAAFRAAAEASNAKDAQTAANVPARKWSDADLGKLCNQAAVKLGDPEPVKAIIAEHVPEGQVAHSRNIPEDGREAFAQAVEAKAGITFAG